MRHVHSSMELPPTLTNDGGAGRRFSVDRRIVQQKYYTIKSQLNWRTQKSGYFHTCTRPEGGRTMTAQAAIADVYPVVTFADPISGRLHYSVLNKTRASRLLCKVLQLIRHLLAKVTSRINIIPICKSLKFVINSNIPNLP